MPECKQSNCENSNPKCSPGHRIVAGVVFLVLAGIATLLLLSAKGHIHLGFWLGVCGFQQRHGLPCPGCGWTHAIEAFVTGHPIQAFVIQPAAVFFCGIAIVAGIYALLVAVFGIHSGFLKRWVGTLGIKSLLAGVVIVILAGWMVTLVRAIIQRNGS